MTDLVLIEGLEAAGIVGVHAWEQRTPRPIRFDVELGFDVRDAAASDHIRDAVDYRAVTDTLIVLTRERPFRLIETLAETAARLLFERFPITSLRLTVAKPGAVPEAKGGVAVRIERRREDYAVCG